MQYKITAQYAKEDEKPLAEFEKVNDARIFVAVKSYLDEKQTIKLVYRIFDHNILLSEINKEKIKIPITTPKYAEGILSFPQSLSIPFRVRQDNLGNEKLIAKFTTLADARIFIEAKIESEGENNDHYLIFNFNKFIEKLDKTFFNLQKSQTSSEERGKKTSFRPTPFSRVLKLGPKSFLIDEDDDDKK